MTARLPQRAGGFSSIELLLALAISSALVAAAAIAYGGLTRSLPRVGSSVNLTLSPAQAANFYNLNQQNLQVSVAPSYGALAQAEDLRERFLEDTLAATAVYCLSRTTINTYRPYAIPYNPATGDIVLDTSLSFRKHLLTKGLISNAAFTSPRNFDLNSNASIFVLGYSSQAGYLIVNAIYDIDIIRAVSPATGWYASVKRYVATATAAAALTQYYDVYYPPPPTPPTVSGALLRVDGENFAPIWVAFERADRGNLSEGTSIDRFKAAAERPFYFIWWPDPAARSLGLQFMNTSNSSYFLSDPRQVYNHMGGRTSFMFTVPVFPAL